MSKKRTTNAVALKTQFTQEDVPSLLTQVNEKIKQLEGGNSNTVRISESLGIFGRISDIKDPNTLRGAYAYITKKAEAVDSFNDVFQQTSPLVKIGSFKENGHSVQSWQEEILTQYRFVTHEAELKKLRDVKSQLESLLSEEHKVQAALSNISDILAK